MLITFRTPAHGDITLFGDVALELIRLMGHRETVPGALTAEDVGPALARLRGALEARPRITPGEADENEEQDEEPVPLLHRALPLMALLEAAHGAGDYVMWDVR